MSEIFDGPFAQLSTGPEKSISDFSKIDFRTIDVAIIHMLSCIDDPIGISEATRKNDNETQRKIFRLVIDGWLGGPIRWLQATGETSKTESNGGELFLAISTHQSFVL